MAPRSGHGSARRRRRGCIEPVEKPPAKRPRAPSPGNRCRGSDQGPPLKRTPPPFDDAPLDPAARSRDPAGSTWATPPRGRPGGGPWRSTRTMFDAEPGRVVAPPVAVVGRPDQRRVRGRRPSPSGSDRRSERRSLRGSSPPRGSSGPRSRPVRSAGCEKRSVAPGSPTSRAGTIEDEGAGQLMHPGGECDRASPGDDRPEVVAGLRATAAIRRGASGPGARRRPGRPGSGSDPHWRPAKDRRGEASSSAPVSSRTGGKREFDPGPDPWTA